MKFSISVVSATLLATVICSPIIIAKENAVGLEKKTAEVAYDYGEYSVEAKREPEKAYDYGEYSVGPTKTKKRSAEKAYDYGEYSVGAKRASEEKRNPEKAYDYGEYSVGP